MSADPDPRSDLEYHLVDLDVIPVEGSNEVVIMPEESEMVSDTSFLIATERDLYDLGDWV